VPEPILDLAALIAAYEEDPTMTHTKWVKWACLCADRVLPSYEVQHKNDHRPREAIRAAQVWVGNPTEENRQAAANAANAAYAAYAAANAAANAANAAAYAAYAAANAAADAVAYAANAADAAAYAAAYAAANAAERQWQAFRLLDVYHNHEGAN
jgi:hypothetical protein